MTAKNEMTQLNIDFDNYTVKQYIADANRYGLKMLWTAVLEYCLDGGRNALLTPDNFGMMYEAGLAERDKESKKKSGQYFTPDDVSCLMARWLVGLEGDNVCDVGCGTGNLMLAYLRQVGRYEAERLLGGGQIYLYDSDELALTIARYSIAIIYGRQYLRCINAVCGDFLNKNIRLPNNAKVITNPPYAKILKILDNWDKTNNLMTGKDYYAAFMEKIALSGARAVIISPYSFLGGNKFYALRKVLNNYNGFIVAFDNVPGSIFNGRKHGVFNSNTANSVRAAITVILNDGKAKGFGVSHLIRFKAEERGRLLNNGYLEGLVSDERQIITERQPAYIKCHKGLEHIFRRWKNQSASTLADLLSRAKNDFALYIPNTCRYFTTASSAPLKRTGVITLYAKDRPSYDLLYCLINSSFAYWWWRIFDGGITYPVGLLKSLPVFDGLLTAEDRRYFADTRQKMFKTEKSHIAVKLNAGEEQENIKFPPEFRQEINLRFLKILGCPENTETFDAVHSEAAFAVPSAHCLNVAKKLA